MAVHARRFYDRGSLAARRAWHQQQDAALEQLQRDELERRIVQVLSAYDPGEAITARGLWQQNELRTAFEEAGICSTQELGKWLRRSGLVECVTRENAGRVWSVSADADD